MITVGTMQLHTVEASDPMEPYFVGGEHTVDMTRISSHDHSGGLLGAPVAVTIPDGSITAADLDPSVLAPYALTDGSKPFTGEVTLQADAVVRDALRFGEQGTALAPDATLSRTGPGALRADTHLGVGVNPAAWGGVFRATQVGQGAALWGESAAPVARLSSNVYHDGAAWRAIATGEAVYAQLQAGAFSVSTAPAVAAGATVTPTTRATIVPTGTLHLTPDAGQPVVVVPSAAGNAIVAPNGHLWVGAQSSYGLVPATDNLNTCGGGANRWSVVWAVAGTISTSSREAKEGITPLDPGRAMEAVRNTPAVTFDYVAPARGPEWYDLPDDPEQAQAVLAQRLTAAPLEAAARHQHGFIAEDCDPLFLVGEGQTSPGSSIGVLLAALQNMDSRLAALEGTP